MLRVLFYISELKVKLPLSFLVFIKLNLMGGAFQRPTVNNIKHLDENVMCKLNDIIDKEIILDLMH